MSGSISKLTVTVEMHAAVDGDRLFADLQEHVAPLIAQGYRSGEMCISDDQESEIRGWWSLSVQDA